MESLYQIVGLDVNVVCRNSYETDSGGRIVFDDSGRALSKSVEMTDYVLYVASFDSCYAIHLSESHGGSYGGRLCTFGHMQVGVVGIDASDSAMYRPLRQCSFYANLWSEDSDYDIANEVFQYSSCGGDECVARGYAWVNRDLFM
jgi:hypothetical protein